jgi:N-acylneuraminate cytidylyltransferase
MPRLPEQVGLLVLDFDGVLTDDRVIVHQDGSESVICSRSDGMGVDLLRRAGLDVVILSTEPNPVVSARGRKLGVPVFQGLDNKMDKLGELVEQRNLDWADVVFVGNDVNDVECLKRAGCGVVPADAHPAAVPHAKIVLSKPGGRGAVRELAELILTARAQVTGTCP